MSRRRLGFEQAGLDLEACVLEPCEPAAGHLGERVGHRRHDAADAGGEDGLGTGRGLALMAAWLERDVERRPMRRGAGRLERDDLGMRSAEACVMPDPNRLAVADDHRPDERVGLDGAPAALGLGQRPTHPEQVVAFYDRSDR